MSNPEVASWVRLFRTEGAAECGAIEWPAAGVDTSLVQEPERLGRARSFPNMPESARSTGALGWLSTLLPAPILVWLIAGLGYGAEETPTEALYTIGPATDEELFDARSQGRQIWVQIEADGRRLTGDDVELTGEWPLSDTPTTLAQLGASSLQFRARQASFTFLHHAWSGAVQVTRDEEATSIPLFSDTSYWAPATPFQSGFPFFWIGVGVVAVLTLVGLLRPWRATRGLPWLIATLALVHLAYWATAPVLLTNDSPGYRAAVEGLRGGYPTYFPVGYGLFMELAGLLPWLRYGHAVTLLQHILVVAVIAVLYTHACRMVDRPWAMLACFLAGAAPAVVVVPQAIVSETWAGSLMVLATTAALAAQRPARWGPVLAGLLTGWATLTRVVPIATLGPILIVSTLFPRNRRSSRACLLALGAACLPVLLVLANAGLRSGRPQLSTGTGRHLFNHFVFEQKLLDPEAPATAALISTLEGDPRELEHWEVAEAIEGGVNDETFLHVALEAARTVGIISHVGFNLDLTWRNFRGSDRITPGSAVDHNRSELAGPRLLGRADVVSFGDSYRYWNSAWGWIVLAFTLSLPATWLVAPKWRVMWVGWLWIPWSYLFASSSVEMRLNRYNTAVTPLVIFQTILVFGLFANAVRAKMHNRRIPAVASPALQTLDHLPR